MRHAMPVEHASRVRLCVAHAPPGDIFLVAAVREPGNVAEAALAAYAQITAVLADAQAEIVQERVFGSLDTAETVLAVRARVLSACGISPAGPVTCLDGRPPWGAGLAGIVMRAVRTAGSAPAVRTLDDDGRPCGRIWHGHETTQIILQNLTADDNGTVAEQATRAIERADSLLRAHSLSYRDVARTWFYLPDILPAYADFNCARSAAYRTFALWPPTGEAYRLPASTGVGLCTRAGAGLTLDLFAVSGSATAPVSVTPLHNPDQGEATRYGSAFARGTLVRGPGLALLELSGTAAIDEQGRSLYPDDARSQIDCTLDKIARLLGRYGAQLANICAATAFVKRPADAAVFDEALQRRGLAELPVLCVVADICRPELLFEMDAEVAPPKGAPQ